VNTVEGGTHIAVGVEDGELDAEERERRGAGLRRRRARQGSDDVTAPVTITTAQERRGDDIRQ
jgi:hypothetical protein